MAESSIIKELPPQHQVFITFQGAKIHHHFFDQLEWALLRNNINIFIDWDDGRDEGRETRFESRIEESKIVLVIFSGKYSVLTWSVRELKMIVGFVEESQLVAIPIFYHLNPFLVECLREKFGDAFRVMRESDATKMMWKNAFRTVPEKMGIVVTQESQDLEVIEEIVEEAKRVLKALPSENIDTGTYEFKQSFKELGEKLDLRSENIDNGTCGYKQSFKELGEKLDLRSENIDNGTYGFKQRFKELGEKLDLRSENIDTGTYGFKQNFKELGEKLDLRKTRSQLGMLIACLLLLLVFCHQYFAYKIKPLLIGMGVPKVLEYTPSERTEITIDKDIGLPLGKDGAKPERFCYSDAKTNAELLDSKDKNFGINQDFKETGEKWDLSKIALGMIIACLLLLVFCLQYITYTFITSHGQGRGAIDRNVVDVPKVLEHIPAQQTEHTIDKYFTWGATPDRSSPDVERMLFSLTGDLRTLTKSLMDGKIIPPQTQVFISFRGVQLRNNFVGYLVHALQRGKVNVYIDNHEQRGEDLNTLFKRIEDSGVAIVVFSSRYTESKWCLKELVKIKERVQQGLLKVLPIFYKVSPTNVKRLKGEFGDHFRDQEHRYGYDSLLIKGWKEAIVFVSHKFALTFDEKSGSLEIDFVETIVKEVLEMLQSVSIVEKGQSSRQHLSCGTSQN